MPYMLKTTTICIFIFLNAFNLCFAKINETRQISLQEAILLAVRQNPNVQISQLNHTLQKFSLEIQRWQFSPHYALNAKATTNRTYSVTDEGQVTENATGITPSVSWLSPVGTKVELSAANNLGHHYNPGVSLQIMQPLLRGFGRPIVEAELYNALDSELISSLQS